MMTRTTILIADDDSGYVANISSLLTKHNYQVFSTQDSNQALLMLQQQHIDLLITNFQLALNCDNKFYKLARAQYPILPILMTTHSPVISDSIRKSQQGHFSFIRKTADDQNSLETIKNALISVPRHIHQEWRNSILSSTKIMDELLAKAQHVAESGVNFVIQGEKGSGKQLLGKAIHHYHASADSPFIYIDCKNLDEEQLYQKLLHNLNSKAKATIYLDSINKLACESQQALLTSLQSYQSALATCDKSQHDLRIICASTDDLEAAMLTGYFDRKLFYLLNIVTLSVPPLRARVADIPMLARHFLAKHSLKYRKNVRSISAGALNLLVSANWPGNIVQLSDTIKQAVLENKGQVISQKAIANIIKDDYCSLLSFSEARAKFEKEYLVSLLEITEGNVTHAARIAQRNRTDFYKLLSKNNISPSEFKAKLYSQPNTA